MTGPPSLQDAELARVAAEAAGAALLGLRPEGGDDLRKRGDALAQTTLSELLTMHRPADAVLSEEAADSAVRLSADRVWIIDPLDGTREYGEGDRHDWAVHVALWERGELTHAAVALPAAGTTLTTQSPTRVPPRPGQQVRLAVSRSRATELALGVADDLGAELVPLGSAGYKVCALLLGEADAYLHSGGQYEWDSAAPVAVARAAGLHTSRIDGSALRYNQPTPYLPDLLVCRPELAQRILELVAQRSPGPMSALPGRAEAFVPEVDGKAAIGSTEPGLNSRDALDGSGTMTSDSALPGSSATVRVDAFSVLDASLFEMTSHIVRCALDAAGRRPYLAFALHVGGLNSRGDEQFRAAMDAADVVYADGMSVVWLARIAGARQIERAGTTDLGWQLLREMGAALGRPARVALVGGPDGLTVRAGQVLARGAGVDIVAAEHGYHSEWTELLGRLRTARPDVLIVGLGAPREMKWVHEHLDELPPCLVLTCGGWFGFLTEDEKRAPLWLQKAGMEWSYRVAQAPRRLAGRYAVGAVTTARLSLPLLAQRRRSRRRP